MFNFQHLKLEEDQDYIDLLEESEEFEVEELPEEDIKDLEIGTESLDILLSCQRENKHTAGAVIAYTCGMLGVKYNDLKIEDLHLNTESTVSKLLTGVIEGLRNLWSKIINFFKKAWTTIKIKYHSFTKNMFNMRKKIYSMRDKRPLYVSEKIIKEFYKDFSIYADFGAYDRDPLRLSIKLSDAINTYLSKSNMDITLHTIDTFEKVFGLFKSNNLDDIDILISKYNDFMSTVFDSAGHQFSKTFKQLTESGHNDNDYIIYKIDLKEQTINTIMIKPEEQRTNGSFGKGHFKADIITDPPLYEGHGVIDYNCLMSLADAVDNCKTFIDQISKSIAKLSNMIDKQLSFFQDMSDENRTKIKFIINDLNLFSKTFCVDYVQNILQHITVLSKWINKLYKLYIKSNPNEGIKDYFEKLQNSKPGEFYIGDYPLQDPSNAKLIQNGDMVYIDFSETDWEGLASIGYSGGFCWSISYKKDTVDDKLRAHGTVDSKTYELEQLGLIFINGNLSDPNSSDIFKRLFNLGGKGIKFVYYHELGHLVTGQHETKLKMTTPDTLPEELLKYGFLEYAYNSNENKADAFACLKTGLSPSDIANYRYEDFIKDIPKENWPNHSLYEVTEKAKIDMEKNITKHLKEMRGYTKLTIFEYMRAKLMK